MRATTSRERQQVIRVANTVALPTTFKLAIKFNVLKVFSCAASDAFLPSLIITEKIEVVGNLDVQVFLNHLLNLLASNSILKYFFEAGDDGTVEKKYRVSLICEFLTEDEDGGSEAPLLLLHHDEVFLKNWYHLNDVIMEQGCQIMVHMVKVFGAHGKTKEFWCSQLASFF
uniref:Uncharacterized protein n=1 Tax=Kalanchoe fedtschenkoi TaxID=63787 RepID=A0A7N0ZUC1_KALFE